MAIEVFNRYEQKYLLTRETFLKVNEAVKQHMEPDAHSVGDVFYPICNIYYDTEDCALIRASVAKPAYKEKLRLRSYGRAKPDDLVYLEIKKKYRCLVNKRRTAIPLSCAAEFVQTGALPQVLPCMNRQVMGELSYFVRTHTLMSKAFVAYDRIAYFDRETHDLRISFDRNLRARSDRLSLTSADTGAPIIRSDVYVMEVKTRFAAPLWLTDLLADHGLYKQSFSKYGSFYLDALTAPAPAAQTDAKKTA